MQDLIINIKENSLVARLAAINLKAQFGMAITIGNTIHLHKASQEDLINNQPWLQHEVAHVIQFKQYGFYVFLFRYLWESLRNGYQNNKYEIEARAMEYIDFKKLRYRLLIQ